jgi:hypothetical protein
MRKRPYRERKFGTTFRILESLDEQDLYFNFNYHWPMHGFGLPEDVLRKLYSENARRVFERRGTPRHRNVARYPSAFPCARMEPEGAADGCRYDRRRCGAGAR